MTQVQLNNLQGLVQTAGVGFCDKDLVEANLTVAGGAGEILNLTTQSQIAALVHVIKSTQGEGSSFNKLVLPEGSLGQIKIVICEKTSNGYLKIYKNLTDANNEANEMVTLSAEDFAICVKKSNTTGDWLAGQSLA